VKSGIYPIAALCTVVEILKLLLILKYILVANWPSRQWSHGHTLCNIQ